MRVFYDHQVTSLQDAGGISRYYFELVRALVAADMDRAALEPELLLGFNRSVLPFARLRPGARVMSYRDWHGSGPARYIMNEALTALVAPLRGSFDIYHATYQRVLPWVHSKSVVATHHDSTPDRFPHLFADAASIHDRLKHVYARADCIICISASSQADLLRYFNIAPEKTAIVHHGFSALPSGTDAIASNQLPAQPYVLFVGARHAYKNFPMLLEAFALQASKDLHLVVAGGGPFNAEETQLIEQLRLSPRVHLLPRVTDQQLAAAYRHAMFFVYPSLYEGFGFPPLEAMSVGCPALVSRSSALPEICGDAAFYFDPESVDDLSTWITKLLEDDALRLSKQQVGLRQVKQYSWQKTAAETLEVYRRAGNGS